MDNAIITDGLMPNQTPTCTVLCITSGGTDPFTFVIVMFEQRGGGDNGVTVRFMTAMTKYEISVGLMLIVIVLHICIAAGEIPSISKYYSIQFEQNIPRRPTLFD